MKPTIGRIVIYHPTEGEKEAMKNSWGIGLACNTQDALPAIIVAVWGDSEDSCINIKVILDGTAPDLWKTSVNRGDQPGQWDWPVIDKN